jgi:hypothetical protein
MEEAQHHLAPPMFAHLTSAIIYGVVYSIFFVGIADTKLKIVNNKMRNVTQCGLLIEGVKKGTLPLYVPIKKLPAAK